MATGGGIKGGTGGAEREGGTAVGAAAGGLFGAVGFAGTVGGLAGGCASIGAVEGTGPAFVWEHTPNDRPSETSRRFFAVFIVFFLAPELEPWSESTTAR